MRSRFSYHTPQKEHSFSFRVLRTRSVGNRRQVDCPHERTHVYKERNPLLLNERVAHEIHERPKAGTGQPRARQVATNLAPPIANCKIARLQQASGKKDARERWSKKGLTERCLLQRADQARAGQELENHVVPIVRGWSKVEQSNSRRHDNARDIKLFALFLACGFESLC